MSKLIVDGPETSGSLGRRRQGTHCSANGRCTCACTQPQHELADHANFKFFGLLVAWMEVRTNGRPRRSIKLKAPRSRRRVGRGHSRAKGRSVHADLYSILLFEIRTLRGRPAAGAVWFALNIDVVQVLFLSEMRQGRRAVLAGYVLCGLTVDGPHSEYSTLSPCVRQRTEKLPLQPQREQQLPRTRSGPAKGWLPRARDMQRM